MAGTLRSLLAGGTLEPRAWRPVPDRAAWRRVDPDARRAIMAAAEGGLGTAWPQPLASQFRRFAAGDGDRAAFEEQYFGRRARLNAAALAALLSGEERWLPEVVDGIWLLLEETTWCASAHDGYAHASPSALPDPAHPWLDLFAAETAGQLAYLDLLLGAEIERYAPLVRRRMADEVRRRVLVPYHDGDWWWYAGTESSPINNWNPWIHRNILAAALVHGGDRLESTVDRVVAGLDNYLAAVPADGGCDEGVSYWWHAGACLYECLDILYAATDGTVDGFTIPVVARIARYPMVVHLGGGWYVNFGDGSARGGGQESARLLYRFAERVGDAELRGHALARRGAPFEPNAVGLARQVAELTDAEFRDAPASGTVHSGHEYLPDTGVLIARQHPGTVAGLTVAVVAGHNGVSHNHNDVGSFIVAVDGRPALIDAGVGEYTRATFGADRYSIWTMRSDHHNLPTINGVPQSPGSAYAAREVTASLDGDAAELRMDLAGAYPAAAGADRWWRTVRLDRNAGRVTVTDDWTLHTGQSIVDLHLMTADAPDLSEPGTLRAGNARIAYDAAMFTATAERIPVSGPKLTAAWGDAVYRVTLAGTVPADSSHRLTIAPA
jgi:heparinase II/III-like protein